MASDNDIWGQLLSGSTFTAMIGTEVDGAFTPLFWSIDGQDEPEGSEFEYGEALKPTSV